MAIEEGSAQCSLQTWHEPRDAFIFPEINSVLLHWQSFQTLLIGHTSVLVNWQTLSGGVGREGSTLMVLLVEKGRLLWCCW
jgi:hypothetical protein